MRRFRIYRVHTYTGYGIGCAITWAVLLLVVAAGGDRTRRHDVGVACAAWWSGWLSATIARAVYPPGWQWPPVQVSAHHS